MKIPEIVGVEMVEWKSGFSFSPVMAPGTKIYHAVSLGRMKIDQNLIGMNSPGIIRRIFGGPKCYVIVFWYAFSEDAEKADLLYDFHVVLTPETTQMEAWERFINDAEWWLDFENLKELEKLIEPPVKRADFPKGDTDAEDVYKARLKVLSPVNPRTVEIFSQSINATETAERERLQREAVQAYFADSVKNMSNEEFKAWQRSNPLDKKWFPETSESMKAPVKVVDPVNYELALNWIKRSYNEMKPDELAEIIYQVTGKEITPVAIRKRHYRDLGLMTKRKPGAKPKV